MADRMVDAVKEYVARALAPIATRLSVVETRIGALSMLLSKGDVTPEKIAALESLEARVRALETRLRAKPGKDA